MDIHGKRPRIRIALTAALLAVAALACDDNGGTNGTADTGVDEAQERPTPTESPGQLGTDQLDRQRADIELVDNEYRPSEVTFDAGDVVTLVLDNTGENGHTFTSPDLDLDIELQFGQQSRVDVELPDTGEFEFYCRFHRGAGMTGVVTAE